MGNLSSHKATKITKLLLIGDPGAGKTGSLASLAKAGFNLRILDLESGLDILANLLRDPKSPYGPEAIQKVHFETITDRMKNSGGKLIPWKATVWQRAMGMLENWRTFEQDEEGKQKLGPDGKPIILDDFGPITTWTEKEVLVIDSLTMLSTAALNFILSLNARLGQQPQQQDWYGGQQLIEGLLQMLYDDGVRCNVIVISHIAYIGDDNGPLHGYPNTLGKALPPKVGRYFNSILMARKSGSGQSTSRKIFTNPVTLIELKNSSPLKVKPDYPLETGLAEYFRDVRT